jgi:hypothetical protein
MSTTPTPLLVFAGSTRTQSFYAIHAGLEQLTADLGDLFAANEYPDMTELRAEFEFRVSYVPITDTGDFRVSVQEDHPAAVAFIQRKDGSYRGSIRHIQTERFGGNNNIPFPVSEHKLGNRSNRLRGSLDAPHPTFSGSQVISTIGTNVEYAASHELGNRKIVTVPAHTRTRKKRVRVESVDKLGKRRTRTKRVWGDAFAVRSYEMQMNIEARAPITTGVAERMPALGEAISADLVAGFGKVGLT